MARHIDHIDGELANLSQHLHATGEDALGGEPSAPRWRPTPVSSSARRGPGRARPYVLNGKP